MCLVMYRSSQSVHYQWAIAIFERFLAKNFVTKIIEIFRNFLGYFENGPLSVLWLLLQQTFVQIVLLFYSNICGQSYLKKPLRA